MLVEIDGEPWAGWALREQGSERISLATVCSTPGEADSLRKAMRLRQSHRPSHQVVAVRITVTEVKS